MSSPYRPIIAVLGYVYDRRERRVLMIHRNARADDAHFGNFNGLGGKVEHDEDVAQAMRRELKEEAHLVARKMILAGTVNWPRLKEKGRDWFGFIFLIEDYLGVPPERNSEGSLFWVSESELCDLPLSYGDRFFLPLVFARPLRPFAGVVSIQPSGEAKWSYSLIES